MRFLVRYAMALLSFLLIDAIWLGAVARNLYTEQIGHLLAGEVNWTAAGIFYLLFVYGLLILTIEPALTKNSVTDALSRSALFGGTAYATYDLTNLATLKSWPVFVTVVDIAWGTALAAVVAAITFFFVKRFKL